MVDNVLIRMTFPELYVDDELKQEWLKTHQPTHPGVLAAARESEKPDWAAGVVSSASLSTGKNYEDVEDPDALVEQEEEEEGGDSEVGTPSGRKRTRTKSRSRSRPRGTSSGGGGGGGEAKEGGKGKGGEDDEDWWGSDMSEMTSRMEGGQDHDYVYEYVYSGDESGVSLPPEVRAAALVEAGEVLAHKVEREAEFKLHGGVEAVADEDATKEYTINVKELVEEAFLALNVQNAHWSVGYTHQVSGEAVDTYEVTFPVLGIKVETLLQRMISIGIGVSFGDLSLLPLELTKPINMVEATEVVGLQGELAREIMAELVIQQVVDDTKRAAEFSFDYVILCVVASLLAGVGLATDNVVVVVASMLVSPIMGPIMELTFGTIIRDWKLSWQGLWKELVGLAICFFVGVLVGLGFAPWGDDLDWPNNEMSSRGTWVGLLIGLTIAIPSGVGVALSTISQNTNSLVGVAISASLLPPAVNAGLNFCYAAVGQTFTDSPVDEIEHIRIGSLSFALTILNILCVYVAAIFMFWIKEVSKIPGKTAFWRHYVPAFRKHRESDAVNGLDGEQAKKFQGELHALIGAIANPELDDSAIVKLDGQDCRVGDLRVEYADLIKYHSAAVSSHTLQPGAAFSPMRTMTGGDFMAYNTVLRKRGGPVPSWAQSF